jgi:hypothetical protein
LMVRIAFVGYSRNSNLSLVGQTEGHRAS